MTTKLPTATVSVCVTLDEAQLIRDAAAVAGLTVSVWAANRTLQALASPKSRANVATAAGIIEKGRLGAPIKRDSRVSMVLRLQDNQTLKDAALGLGIKAHAFAQAALIDAADRELKNVPPAVVAAAEAVRKPGSRSTTLISAPLELADLDVAALAEVVRQLITATAQFIMQGNGPGVVKGIARVIASNEVKPQGTFKLAVPEFDLRAVAYVLGVRPEPLATALLIKAATTVRERA